MGQFSLIVPRQEWTDAMKSQEFSEGKKAAFIEILRNAEVVAFDLHEVDPEKFSNGGISLSWLNDDSWLLTIHD